MSLAAFSLPLAQSGRAVLADAVASVRRTFAVHLPLYAAAILFCGITIVVAGIYNAPLPLGPSLIFIVYAPIFGLFALALAAVVKFFMLVCVERPAHPLPVMGRWLAMRLIQGDRPGHIVHTCVTFVPLMVSFNAMKSALPLIHPFAWDATFAHLDRMLFFGHEPWRLLQPWLGHPAITMALNVNYNLWFFVMFGALFLEAFRARGDETRLRFLIAFALAWFIAGNVLAVIFSSAGPCFYGLLGLKPDPYAAQMAYLNAATRQWPIWSLNVQHMLWQSYRAGGGAIAGISAMPSLHVTVATLIALLGWRRHRIAGIVLSISAVLVALGSVHLAWHYAVDGIAGCLLAFAFWALAGVIARWTLRRCDCYSGATVSVMPSSSGEQTI